MNDYNTFDELDSVDSSRQEIIDSWEEDLFGDMLESQSDDLFGDMLEDDFINSVSIDESINPNTSSFYRVRGYNYLPIEECNGIEFILEKFKSELVGGI